MAEKYTSQHIDLFCDSAGVSEKSRLRRGHFKDAVEALRKLCGLEDDKACAEALGMHRNTFVGAVYRTHEGFDRLTDDQIEALGKMCTLECVNRHFDEQGPNMRQQALIREIYATGEREEKLPDAKTVVSRLDDHQGIPYADVRRIILDTLAKEDVVLDDALFPERLAPREWIKCCARATDSLLAIFFAGLPHKTSEHIVGNSGKQLALVTKETLEVISRKIADAIKEKGVEDFTAKMQARMARVVNHRGESLEHG